jgi:hypothetical protein
MGIERLSVEAMYPNSETRNGHLHLTSFDCPRETGDRRVPWWSPDCQTWGDDTRETGIEQRERLQVGTSQEELVELGPFFCQLS